MHMIHRMTEGKKNITKLEQWQKQYCQQELTKTNFEKQSLFALFDTSENLAHFPCC